MINANKKADGKADVRMHNTAMALRAILERGPYSRAGLAKELGLTRATASSIVADLIGAGLVVESELEAPKKGRPGMLLKINPEGGCAIGVDLNVNYVRVVCADFGARVLWESKDPSSPLDPQPIILERTERLISRALEFGAGRGLRLLGIGVGLPGLVNRKLGVLDFAPNLKWRDLDLKNPWAKKFKAPLFVENEANAAAMGEYYFGAAKGAAGFVYLSVGVGIGGAVMMDGALCGGASGYAGEIGHMRVDPNGELCGCGRRGCWETEAGPSAAVRKVKARLEEERGGEVPAGLPGSPEDIDFPSIARAAAEGDALCREVLAEVAAGLGQGVASILNIFNPDMVVIGGEILEAGPYVMPLLKSTAMENALAQAARGAVVTESLHGPNACAVGAAALVLDEIYNRPILPEKME